MKSSLLLCISLIVVGLLLGAKDSCSKSAGVERVDAPKFIVESANKTCASDDECTAIKAGCCGCTQGGQQEAVSKLSAKSLVKSIEQSCENTVCMQVISNDTSCKQKPACINDECQLR